MMFETCRRHEELDENINLKECAFCWFTLYKLECMKSTLFCVTVLKYWFSVALVKDYFFNSWQALVKGEVLSVASLL
jgi:hypothetical protein